MMKEKMKKHVMGSLLIVMAVIVMGCSSGKSSDEAMSENTSYSDTTDEAGAMDMDMNTDVVENEENFGVDGTSNIPVGMNLDDSRKYILTYNYEMETLTFDETQNRLNQLISMHNGYYESTQVSGRNIRANYPQRRHGSFSIRIPKDQIVSFLEGLKTIGGNILDEASNQEDVTNQYYDLDARIKTLEVQEERLISILETADELEYILELERELSDVRYEIERNMSTFRNLENRISYTTIRLNLQEVIEETIVEEEPTSFFEKMTFGFKESLNAVADFFETLALFFITQSPILIIIGIFVFIAYKIVRWIIKKISQSQTKKDE